MVVGSALAAFLIGLPQILQAAPQQQTATQAANAQNSDLAARLNKKQFKDVKATIDNGIATLTGTVDLYQWKADAERRVHRAKGVVAVRNLIEVTGAAVDDKTLQAKLAEKLSYDRVFYGNAFNAIGVNVENGQVTLSGHARTPVDKESALALVATTSGVKDLVDEIEVDPASSWDDETRIRVAHAIYDYPSLSRYGSDPAKPIRISVQNGHVELYGMVDTQADKDTAYLRAMGVSNVFSVKNYLAVAGQTTETKK
jgi:osmotically-inducible protein OsmY